jgi:hypothetical protein
LFQFLIGKIGTKLRRDIVEMVGSFNSL